MTPAGSKQDAVPPAADDAEPTLDERPTEESRALSPRGHRPSPILIAAGVVAALALAAVVGVVAASRTGGSGQPLPTAPIAPATLPTPPRTLPASTAPVGTSAGAQSTPPGTPVTGTTSSRPATDDWPRGLNAWTVVYAAVPQSAPRARARRAAAAIRGGVLDPSLHAGLGHGFWLVYRGQFHDVAAARTAAARAQSHGHPAAYVRRISS